MEIFEARNPKGAATLAEVGGRIEVEQTERGPKLTLVPTELGKQRRARDPVEYQSRGVPGCWSVTASSSSR